jgi:hypothetical protein
MPGSSHRLKGFGVVCRAKPDNRQDKNSGINPDRQILNCPVIIALDKNMKKIIFAVLSDAFLYFGSCCVATAQAPVAQGDQITTDGQEIIQDDDTGSGEFESVTVGSIGNVRCGVAIPCEPYKQTRGNRGAGRRNAEHQFRNY